MNQSDALNQTLANQSQELVVDPTESFIKALLSGKKYLIIGHQNPDGDSLGSSVALILALRELGKEAMLGVSGQISSNLLFLLNDFPGVLSLPQAPSDFSDYDAVVLVDCQDPGRIWAEAPSVKALNSIEYLVVDHHQNRSELYSYKAAYVNHKAAATAELVFRVIKDLGVQFSPKIVEALLAALISDTGSFSQANATAESLRQASELVALGGDIEQINRAIKHNWSVGKFRLFACSLASLTIHCGGRVAALLVTKKMLKVSGGKISDTEGLVEYPLLIAGVEISALFKDNCLGQIRVSLRSREGIDVRTLASSMGGGGHLQAAAYLDDNPSPKKARSRFLVRVDRYFKFLSQAEKVNEISFGSQD
ncbi:MAG: bifunctional oligoribonuclease/PAP phosphatase NrnA [Deltaproteobacteria bacterium]|jgi:phosphoesterase RecJ-like protein|nr:bifunctional oligoribonuclease/PAP phosphatase NrnA [Deltaproteobacteria bacterium]